MTVPRFLRSAALSILLPAAATVAVAQSGRNVDYSDPEERGEKRPLITMADAPGLIVTALVLLGVPLVVFLVQRRRVALPDDRAEERFEREAMLQMRAAAAAAPPSPPAIPAVSPEAPPKAGDDFLARPYIARARGFDEPGWSDKQTHASDTPAVGAAGIVVEAPIGSRAPAHVVPPATPAMPPVAASGVDAPPATVEELARRLQALGVLGEVEGRVALAIPPDGLICRLRRTRGMALLLPRLESDAVMGNFARRFDMVFALSSAGEPLVLSRLQTRLSEMLEMK